MRIAVIAPIEEPVPPVKYGGTELVVYNLCEELVKKGHEVYLLAAGDSKTSAHLVPLIPQSLRQSYTLEEIDKRRNPTKIMLLASVLRELKHLQPDIVYNHQGWRFVPFIEFVDCPVYTTIHGPLNTDNEVFTYEQYPNTPLVSISHNQRKAMPKLNWVKTIYNGIDPSLFTVGKPEERTYFAFLGRTSPEKGLKEICQMIKQTKHALKIAAKVDNVDIPYFEQEIKPLIDGQQIEFVGEIGPQEKAAFLSRAKGLLLWLNWEEPFGLVVVEAMASGTPVIVNKRGSMPEIVIDGKNGYLVNSLEDMKKRLDDISNISNQECRTYVEKNFSTKKMTQGYLELAGKESN